MLGKIHTTEQFEHVRNEGGRWRSRFCLMNAAKQTTTPEQMRLLEETGESPNAPTVSNVLLTRVGYITSKKIGKAVKRNRARRLMREAMRHLDDSIVEGWDIVLVAQSKIVFAKPKMQDVKDDLQWLLNQAHLIKPTMTTPPVKEKM